MVNETFVKINVHIIRIFHENKVLAVSNCYTSQNKMSTVGCMLLLETGKKAE